MDPISQPDLSRAWDPEQKPARLWKALLNEVELEGFAEGHDAELTQLILSSASRYAALADHIAVRQVLRRALKSEKFFKTFTTGLVRAAASPPAAQQSFLLLCWSVLVIDNLRLPEARKPILRLIECQAKLLDVLNQCLSNWGIAMRHYEGMLKSQPQLVQECTAAASASGSTGLIRALTHSPHRCKELQNALLPLYLQRVLGSRDKVAPADLRAYAPLLHLLSEPELAESVLPMATRMMKRSPETVLPVMAALFQAITVDVSMHAVQILTDLLPQLRHAKEPIRTAAISTVHALVQHVSAKSRAELFAVLKRLLDGSAEGKPRGIHERTGLVNAVAALSSCPQSDGDVATEVTDFLCHFYRDEANEEVKIRTVVAMGAWLQSLRSVPTSVLTRLSDGFKEKDALRRAHLRALLQAIDVIGRQDHTEAACYGSIVPALAKLVTDGIAKPALRADGVLALLALALIAPTNSQQDTAVQDQVWSAVRKPDCVLLAPASLSKLGPEEAVCAAQLAQTLLLQHHPRLPSGNAVEETLTALMLHYNGAVRRMATHAAAHCIAESPQLCLPLLCSVQRWLEYPGSIPQLSDPTIQDDSALPTQSIISARFLTALLALTPAKPVSRQSHPQSCSHSAAAHGIQENGHSASHTASASVDSSIHAQLQTALGTSAPAELLARLISAAHHPVVLIGRTKRRSAWRLIKKQLHPQPQSWLSTSPETAVAMMLGTEGATAAMESSRQAARGGLACIMAEAPDAVYPFCVASLQQMLARQEHDELSDDDIKIFQTPDGQLALQVDLNQVTPLANGHGSGLKQTKAALLSKRVMSGGLSAVSRTTSAATSKASGKAAKDPAAEMRERQLLQESAVRQQVQAIQEKLELGLLALCGVATGNLPFTAGRLQDLAALVQPLLSSPLVGEGPAFEAMVALACSLSGPLGKSASAVAAGMRIVELGGGAYTGYDSSAALPTHAAVVNAIAALEQATAGAGPKPLEPPAYLFVFPILAAVLKWPTHTPLHDAALNVVALHVDPDRDIPRAASLDMLFSTLNVLPAFRVRVDPLVHRLCEGLLPSELPAALNGLLYSTSHVRAATLAALPCVPCLAAGQCPEDEEVQATLWMSCHDPVPANTDAALLVWSTGGCVLSPECVRPLMRFLAQPAADVRAAAADALATSLEDFPSAGPELLANIISAYTQDASINLRSGIALALNASAPQWRDRDATIALDFLLGCGFAERDDDVRRAMVEAGVALVDAHGAAIAQALLPLFEGYLERKNVGDELSYDLVREGVVICLGTLARHLDRTDPKVRTIIGTLLEALSTPSANVQVAASDCLSPLMPAIKDDRAYVETFISRLLKDLMTGSSYGVRRGAAHGLAGAVKGLNIRALNDYGILDALKKGLDDTKNVQARQGALFGFECLCAKLGRLFEPYVVQLIGKLLELYGDSSDVVRQANGDAAKAVMAHLSSYGVKLVLPALLDAVESKTWRAKQGSVQLLGSMAYLAPRQLGTALPQVVPRLATLLSDPHPKVQGATQKAFRQVGSVIQNPEVSQMVPVLLAAIGDPNTAGKVALDTLLSTTFVNTVDAASLALIVPVVHRGLRDRSGDVKKRASRIVGNMCQLINNSKDMAPYVPLVMPELQAALVDPLPEVRATAARAMGSLLRSMGDDLSKQVMPWLLQTLKSDGSSVERSGAAQGLAEALAALGRSHLDALLPSILAQCTNRSASVREGHLTLLKFLPLALPDSFLEHLEEVLPAILGGLADEAEGVREAALAAGRTMVDLFAESALPLLLPAVELGVVHNNWRIRQSSVELLGDLLFRVAGTSGKVQQGADEDTEGISSDAHAQAITEVLGEKRRHEVFARIYMARSDVGFSVRAAALHVWKTIVSNTPRTLSEILPALMDQLIASLASSGEERQQMASRCLGELVRKMGERVLKVIIPILRKNMAGESSATRQGVCFGLKELLDNVSRQQLAEHLSTLLPTLQGALLDSDASVRQAAGSAFSVLFKGGAGSAVDSIIPSLLAGLSGSDKQSNQALEGLRVILGVRPQSFATMVPKLLKPPLTKTSIVALASLAEAAGTAIHGHLVYILPPLLTIASDPSSSESMATTATAALTQVASAVAEDGVYLLMGQIDRGLEDPAKRKGAAATITHFCRNSKLDYQEHIPQLLSSLASLMGEEDPDTLQLCWAALSAVTSTIPKEVAPSHVRCVKDAIATAGDRLRRKQGATDVSLPGFCLPKALTPVLPIYLQGLLQGSSTELRELAAEGLGDLVRLTSADALKPFVVQITGPLIRILGDRFAWEIKAAILQTLGLLIAKAGPNLKPFVPQLQTTFLKCLADQAKPVRQSAGENLGALSALSARADALAADLATNASTATGGTQEAYLVALRGVLASSGQRLTSATLSKAAASLHDLFGRLGGDEAAMVAVARCLGPLACHCSSDELTSLVLIDALSPPGGSQPQRLGQALTLSAVAHHAPDRLEEEGLLSQIVQAVTKTSRDPDAEVRCASCRAAGALAAAEIQHRLPHGRAITSLLGVMTALLGSDQVSEVHRQQMQVLRRLAVLDAHALDEHLAALVPSVCALLSSAVGPTKLAAERTLARLLRVNMGPDTMQQFVASGQGGVVARTSLTDYMQRRLTKLPLNDQEDLELPE